MEMKKDMMQIVGLVLALFLLAIVVGITYVGAGEFKSTLCTQAESTYVYTNGVCANSTGSEQTVDSIVAVDVVLATITTVLGLVGLVVIILIFGIVVRVAKGFGGSFN